MNKRISRLKKILTEKHLDAFVISSTSNIIYLTGYSGFSVEEREAFLLISRTKNFIITDSRYTEAVVKKIPNFKFLEISVKKSLKQILSEIKNNQKIKKIGIEENNITVAEYAMLKKEFKTISPTALTPLRSVKEPSEITHIQQACKLGDKAFKHLLPFIKKGVTEKELAGILESFVRKQGYEMSFKTIVAFGPNAATPHHLTSNRKLTKNNFVLVDFGIKFNNYCSDMTRTVFFGSASAEFKRMYQTVLEAQEKAIEYLENRHSGKRSASRIRSWTSQDDIFGKDADRVAREHIESQGFPSIPHSLGHGIGLEVHEAPRLSPKSKDKLKPGMVFSIEPGIYLPGSGGVRIEDLVTISSSGVHILTRSPKELIEL